MLIQPSQNDDMPFPALEGAGGGKERMMQPRAFDFVLTAARAVQFHCDGLTMEVGIEQRDIDVLPCTGFFAVEQGACYSAHGVNAGTDVADRDHRHVRWTLLLTDQRSYSGVSLSNEVEARIVRERTGLSEC